MKPEYHHFKLEKYTSYPILCNFMRPFLNFEKSRDTRHCHEDFYELVIFVDGTVLDRGMDENVQILQPGYFFIYAPGSIHHYDNMLNTKYFNILIHQSIIDDELLLKKDCMPEFEKLFPEYAERTDIFQLDDSGLKKAIDLSFELKREQDEKAPGYREMIPLLLAKLLIVLWRNRKLQTTLQDNVLSFRISKALTFMEKNLERNLTLEEIAQHVSMSESSFRHYFKEVTKFSPIQYLVILRLKSALQMIFIGRSINDSAKLSGLRDSSYLGRMVRRYLELPLHHVVEMLTHSGTTPDVLFEKLMKQ
ncbi:MAG: AraC family transcriptional regulator [Lentisphaerae bacterium]|nr:AraC family transcriptional regulator [Lentisphaerota bacterium]